MQVQSRCMRHGFSCSRCEQATLSAALSFARLMQNDVCHDALMPHINHGGKLIATNLNLTESYSSVTSFCSFSRSLLR